MVELVVVGTIGLDDIETPFGKVESVLGGSGVYASKASSFFTKTGLVSIVGKDMPEKGLAVINEVDLSGVEQSEKTFRWSGYYEFDMNEAKTKKTELNSLTEFKPKLPDNFKKAKYLFLGNIDPALQIEVLDQMENSPFILLDTMNYWIDTKKEDLLKVIERVDVLVINEGEARQLFGTPNLIKAGKMILESGPKFGIIKKGEHGALLFSKEGFFSAPGYPLEVVKDPTGAGDSFAGGLIGYLAKTGDNSEKNMRKAIVYGSTIASFCAENFSLKYCDKLTLDNIEERYSAFEQIRKF